MMIAGDDLATVKIDRVIFHDVPSNKKHETGNHPTFSDVETPVDATRKTLLRTKLVQVLGSRSAFPIRFDPDVASPVPENTRLLTASKPSTALLVSGSQK